MDAEVFEGPPEPPVAQEPERGHVVELAESERPLPGWIELSWEDRRYCVRPSTKCMICLGRGAVVTRKGPRHCNCVARRMDKWLKAQAKARPAPLRRTTTTVGRDDQLRAKIDVLRELVRTHDQEMHQFRRQAEADRALRTQLIDEARLRVYQQRDDRQLHAAAASISRKTAARLRNQARRAEQEAKEAEERAAVPVDLEDFDRAERIAAASAADWAERLRDPPKVHRARTQLARLETRLARRQAVRAARQE